MDHRVTQCPRCGTSFRVTEAHLAVAAGAVRCGSCLHIFNAREHWADEQPAAAARPPAAAQKSADDFGDDELIDDDPPLFEDGEDDKPAGSSIFTPGEDDFGEMDPEHTDGDELSDSFLDLNSWEEEPASPFIEADPDVEESGETEEQWTSRLLADDEEEAIRAPQRSNIFDDDHDILSQVPETEDTGEDDETFLDIPDARPLARTAEQAEPGEPAFGTPGPEEESAEPDVESIDYGLESLRIDADERIGDHGRSEPGFGHFEPEPLQLHQFVREPRWPKVLWGLGLAGALLLALGQYLYFNFDTLSRGELRPWLARACGVFSCTLPAQSDIERIHAGSLIVRSHPTQRGALAVDAILTNQAPFAQPYPQLLLQFTDLNGAPVAGRVFKPAEYLGGELTGSHLMPAQQPVHIALELVDPGPRAVNYQLIVAPPDNATH